MKISKLIIVVLLICLYSQTFSQTETSTEPTSYIRPFGVGIHLEQFKIHDMGGYSENVPSNKIILIINPRRWLRLEPEFGFHSYKRTSGENDHKNSFINMGLGTFGMTQFNRLNMYYGARFEYNIKTSNMDLYPDGETIKKEFFTLGPAIGCEYFVAKQITLGGEFGVKYGTKSYDEKDSEFILAGDEINLWTDTGLFLRFYF